MEKTTGASEQICRRKIGKWKCKNARSDNRLQYCEKHYKAITDFCKKQKTKKEKLMNISGDGEGAGCSVTGVETRGSKSRKKVIEQSHDETGGIQSPSTTDIDCGSVNVGTTRENVERTQGSGELDLLTENPTVITSNKMNKEKKQLPPHEHRCIQADNRKWRCKNFRMGHGASDDDTTVPKAKYCEKHYYIRAKYNENFRAKYYENLKKRSRNGEGATDIGHIEETRGYGRRKKAAEEDDGTEILYLGATNHDNSFDMECGSGNVGTKRKNIQRTQGSGEQDVTGSLTENPSLITSKEQYCCQTAGKGWRCKNFKMSHGAAGDDASVPHTKYYREKFLPKRSGDGGGADAGCSTATGPVEIRRSEEDERGEIQPAASDNTSDIIIEGGSANISRKRKNVETTEESGEHIVESESLEDYKSNCFESSVELEKTKAELKKKNVELENMRVEYTKLKGKLAEVDETSKSNAKDEDATKYWKNKCSEFESLVLRLELENSTMRCEGSRVSNLQSLVPRNGHENSILRCSELRNPERIIKSEAWGLQDGGRNLHLLNQTGNVDERKGSGCLEEERPPQDHLEKPGFVNLVSDDENVVESEYSGSHGGMHGKSEDAHSHSEILGKSGDSKSDGQILGRSDKMKWESEDDMSSSFQEDIELCMKAVCALYRLEDEILLKRLLLSDSEDKLRCTALAKFLMDGDCKGYLKKSVKDLEVFDSTAVADCKKLAKRYSPYLFYMYENGNDHFSVPATTASHGDQTAK